MKTLITALSPLLLAGVLAGCGGGSSTTTPNPTPEEQSRTNAVAMAGDVAAAELSAETPVTAMMGDFRNRPTLNDLDSCTTFDGTRASGSLTYNDCTTPRGTLNGTVSWTVNIGSRTTQRDLTFTSAADGSVRTLTGSATWTRTANEGGDITIHRTGNSMATEAAHRAESDSDLSWTWQRLPDIIERSYPSGTIHTAIFEGDTLTHEVLLTFDGTATVTATVDGETYTYRIDQRRARPERRTRR